MSEWRQPLGINVLEAARDRIARVFDDFQRVCVSFSGGKDSTVMLHLAADEAARRGRTFGLLFIDWEAQYKLTIDHVERCFDLYSDLVEPYWIALPLKTVNAVSMFEPEWTCWDPDARDRWVREIPDQAISESSDLPFYRQAMTFEEFVPEFGQWYAGGQTTACLVGIRTRESLNRWRSITGDSSRWRDWPWTTWKGGTVFNSYPIYDWRAEDIWTYHGRYPDKLYNALYDRMHAAGVSLHQMRICEPYGDEQRKGLWLFHVIEPETWGKIVARVNGANSGALYATESGNILGNLRVSKPNGHNWESFAKLLLGSMPERTAEHYKNKIAVWMRWYLERGFEIQDEIEGDTGSEDKPSWRRVCKMLLKNDYWAKTLCFSPTKSEAYERYVRVMRNRRKRWRLPI